MMPATGTGHRLLLVLGAALSLLLAVASADCEAYVPPSHPGLVSPILGDGPPVVYPAVFTFVWDRVSMGVCAGLSDEIYEVVVGDPDSEFVYSPENVICTANASYSCVGNYTQLTDGETYYWALRVVTNATTDFGTFYPLTGDVFVWCVPSSPDTPVTTDVPGPIDADEDITFAWGLVTDFGESCVEGDNTVTLVIFQDDINNPVKSFPKPPSTVSFVYEPFVLDPLPAGNYSWVVISSNSYLESTSAVYNFTISPAPPVVCSPACQNGGVCNGTTGVCKCKDGFTGAQCQNSNEPTPAPQNIGLIVGLSVAGVVVIILIAVLLILYFNFTRKKHDVEMSILIEPPDFAVLALEPYEQLKSSPFLELNSKKPSWKTLENLFLAEDSILVQSLLTSAKIIHMDALCSSLIILFESRGAGSTLVQKLMLRELMEFKVTKGAAPSLDANPMPYRGDSAATKAFKVYCRLVGMPYLFETLGQILNDFCALMEADAKKAEEEETAESKSTSTLHRKSNFTPASMEVDPSKMNSDEDETINRLSLQLICQKIFVKIFRSVNIFPHELRVLFKKIREESAKNDNLRDVNSNVLLSNLVFLRFVNPSIIMPKNFGLVKDEPSDAAKRQLVLVTKVLQNLAAGVEFGKKESFMTKLNDFIRANSGQMNNFLTELTEKVDSSGSHQISVYSVPISQFHSNAAVANLYEYLYTNHAALHESIRREASPNKANQVIKAMMDAIEEFGDPSTYKK